MDRVIVLGEPLATIRVSFAGEPRRLVEACNTLLLKLFNSGHHVYAPYIKAVIDDSKIGCSDYVLTAHSYTLVDVDSVEVTA